jgi:hypothetical protein
MTASKPWKARAPSADVSVWSLRTPQGSSIIDRSSVIFVPMIGATYIWNSFLARFSLERDRQRVAAFVPFLRRDVGRVTASRWTEPNITARG